MLKIFNHVFPDNWRNKSHDQPRAGSNAQTIQFKTNFIKYIGRSEKYIGRSEKYMRRSGKYIRRREKYIGRSEKYMRRSGKYIRRSEKYVRTLMEVKNIQEKVKIFSKSNRSEKCTLDCKTEIVPTIIVTSFQ